MSKMKNFLNRPAYQSILNFINEYISLAEIYWGLGNDTVMSAIEASQEQVLIDKIAGDKDYPLVKKSDSEINAYFHNRRIAEYKKIPDEVCEPIKARLDKSLKNHIGYASSLNLNIPANNHLSTHQYYYNYIVLKKLKPTLELKLEVPSKKK